MKKALRFLPAVIRFGLDVLDAAADDGKIDKTELAILAKKAAKELGLEVNYR